MLATFKLSLPCKGDSASKEAVSLQDGLLDEIKCLQDVNEAHCFTVYKALSHTLTHPKLATTFWERLREESLPL